MSKQTLYGAIYPDKQHSRVVTRDAVSTATVSTVSRSRTAEVEMCADGRMWLTVKDTQTGIKIAGCFLAADATTFEIQ